MEIDIASDEKDTLIQLLENVIEDVEEYKEDSHTYGLFPEELQRLKSFLAKLRKCGEHYE